MIISCFMGNGDGGQLCCFLLGIQVMFRLVIEVIYRSNTIIEYLRGAMGFKSNKHMNPISRN